MTTAVRKPTAVRREEIARASLRIVGRRGPAALTTTALAEEIGVTSGALFRHFASREDILREVVRYALEQVETTFPDPALPPLERLLSLARSRSRLLGANPGLAWLLHSEQACHALPPDAAADLKGLVARSRRFLLDALRDGAAIGTVRADAEPEALLVPVLGTIHVLAGLSGPRHRGGSGTGSEPEAVLRALALLLAPPSVRGGNAAQTRTRTRKGKP